MSNPNGKKGAAFERVVADYLAEHVDDRIDRRAKTGALDKGDIGGLRVSPALMPGLADPMPTARAPFGKVAVECKSVGTMALSAWVTEADIERGNDDALAGVVVHKRRGVADPGDQYVTCTLRDLVALITGRRP